MAFDLPSGPAEEAALRALAEPGAQSEPERRTTLLKALRDERWRLRKAALEGLLALKDRGAVARGLLETLGDDESAGGRNSAAEGLVRMGEGVIPLLARSYRRASSEVRKFLVEIVGTSGSVRGIELLRKGLSDADQNVRSASVEAAGKLAARGRNPTETRKALKLLVASLESDRVGLRFDALEALSRLSAVLGRNPSAVALETLLGCLEVPLLKRPALAALAATRRPEAAPPLARALGEEPRAVHDEAARGLAALASIGPDHERAVRDALAGLPRPGLLEGIIDLLGSPDPPTRRGAAALAGLIGASETVPALLRLARIDEEAREEAILSIERMGGAAADFVADEVSAADGSLKALLCRSLGRIGLASSAPPLASALADEDPLVRAEAARALGLLGPEAGGLPPLLDLLDDPDEEAQAGARGGIESLARKNAAQVRSEVEPLLSSPSALLRRNAVLLVGALRGAEAIEPLKAALRDEETGVRRAAVEALSRAGAAPEARDGLLLALADEDAGVRLASAHALAEIRLEGAAEALGSLAGDPDPRVRAAAGRALAAAPSPRTRAPLERLLRDPSGLVALATLEGLRKAPPRERARLLSIALSHPDPEVREEARRSRPPRHLKVVPPPPKNPRRV